MSGDAVAGILFLNYMLHRKYCILNCDSGDAENLLCVLQEFQEFQCVGISDTYDSAINMVLKFSPDIIIVNIDSVGEKTHNSPFTLISELFQFLDYTPTFIAISSSTEKAYDVIKLGFFDYLLKPLRELDVRKCVVRIRKECKTDIPLKICLKSHSDYRFIDLNKILYLQADNNCTDFFLKDEAKISGFKSLKHYETLLPENFLRVHNSYVINTDYLIRINFGKSTIALVGQKENIPFSRSHREDVEMLRKSLRSLHSVQA